MLVRLVVVADGVVWDRRRRLPGRGAWVCPDATCAKRAARHLPRALRLPPTPVRIEDLHRLLAGESSVLGGQPGGSLAGTGE